ncbi:guanine nucleotide-binding protein alpha subunit [Acrasis kona]|uniref:Guanine nucleotide-binding protein alpha subunit n=1 Tax=Acrasis kona TaxID=1008807 RepID=A0AAW2ZMF2_9EUKA
MGCIVSKRETETVNPIVQKLNEEADNQIKVLLLGAGESGKSTIFKQMKIIHKNGFTIEDLKAYKSTVRNNIVKSMKSLITAAYSFNYKINGQKNVEAAEFISSIDEVALVDIGRLWTVSLADQLRLLWLDPSIQAAYRKRHLFQLDESAPYYMKNIERISKEDYLPTQEDVLRTRVKTTGIVEMEFRLAHKLVYMLDVGGQRTERKKWLHCFEAVSAVIFVISAPEYDLKCYEDNHTPRMNESLNLFWETINSNWFPQTPIIVFLNKMDIFKEKLVHSPMKDAFPEYNGGANLEAGIAFLEEKLRERSKFNNISAVVPVSATDTRSLQIAFNAIEGTLLKCKPGKKYLAS